MSRVPYFAGYPKGSLLFIERPMWAKLAFPMNKVGDRIRGTLGDIDPLNRVPC